MRRLWAHKYFMSIYEKARMKLTDIAREAFGDPDLTLPESWLDTPIVGFGMSPRLYLDQAGEDGIEPLAEHIRGVAAGIHA